MRSLTTIIALVFGMLSACATTVKPRSSLTEAYKELFDTEIGFSETYLQQRKDPDAEGDTYLGVLAAKKWAVVVELYDQLGSSTPDPGEARALIRSLVRDYGATGAFTESALRPPVFSSPYDLSPKEVVKIAKSRTSPYYSYLARAGSAL